MATRDPKLGHFLMSCPVRMYRVAVTSPVTTPPPPLPFICAIPINPACPRQPSRDPPTSKPPTPHGRDGLVLPRSSVVRHASRGGPTSTWKKERERGVGQKRHVISVRRSRTVRSDHQMYLLLASRSFPKYLPTLRMVMVSFGLCWAHGPIFYSS